MPYIKTILINFYQVNIGDKSCASYNLAYSSSIVIRDAVAYAYKHGSQDMYVDVGLQMCCIIKQALNDLNSMLWPPTADELKVDT